MFSLRSMVAGLVFSLVMLGANPVLADEEMLGRIMSPVDEILKERAQEDWRSLGEEASSARARKIDRMRRNALGILADSQAQEVLDRLDEIRRDRILIKEKIAEMRTSRAAAPTQGPEISIRDPSSFVRAMMTRTKADWDLDIRTEEERLEKLDREVAGIKERMQSLLGEVGINVERSQIDALVDSVTAGGMVEMHAVYLNLAGVNEQLLEAVEESGESMETARRYYGLYAVMLEIVVAMHDGFLEDVDIHRKRLAEIREEAQKLKGEAQKMLGESRNDHEARILRSNIASQDLTYETAGLYDQYLSHQVDEVSAARMRVLRELTVAINTYRTVRLSSDLVELMRSQTRDFEMVSRIQLPRLRPFESNEMRQEFERLTERLAVPTS